MGVRKNPSKKSKVTPQKVDGKSSKAASTLESLKSLVFGGAPKAKAGVTSSKPKKTQVAMNKTSKASKATKATMASKNTPSTSRSTKKVLKVSKKGSSEIKKTKGLVSVSASSAQKAKKGPALVGQKAAKPATSDAKSTSSKSVQSKTAKNSSASQASRKMPSQSQETSVQTKKASMTPAQSTSIHSPKPSAAKKAKSGKPSPTVHVGRSLMSSLSPIKSRLSGDVVCRESNCDGLATSGGYCRLHYIKNWKKIKRKEVILQEHKLNQYIEELVLKYPDKYIEAICVDLANDKEFAKVIYDLDLDESEDDFESDSADSADSLIDSIKREFDDESDAF